MNDTLERKSIAITRGTGMIIRFPNGWSVSVQIGPGTYSDNHWASFAQGQSLAEGGSDTAETAVFNPDGGFVPWRGDDVQGHQEPASILETLNWAASQPAKAKPVTRTTKAPKTASKAPKKASGRQTTERKLKIKVRLT